MTFAQFDESAHQLTNSARERVSDQQHDAHDQETANMSNLGPEKHSSMTKLCKERERDGEGFLPLSFLKSQSLSASIPTHSIGVQANLPQPSSPPTSGPSAGHTTSRIRFGQFAEHIRRQKYVENRRRLLRERKRVLQKTIALSGRLQRLSSWVRDGLVEISDHSDASCFVRVHRHMQSLVDWSYSQWNLELHALDSIETSETAYIGSKDLTAFLPRLSRAAQTDVLSLLSCLRSNPKFLVERFKSLRPAQVQALSACPIFDSFSESPVAALHNSHTKKVKTYSRALEDYASSFERSNPLSFLLFNIYGISQSPSARENQLRLATWSTVCAELFIDNKPAYEALWPQLTSSFASIHEWRLKDAVELFLMEVLQKGAFLLELMSHEVTPGSDHRNPLHTPQAQQFFEQAILDLFSILVKHDGGFPTGALQFASAVISKLPNIEQQSAFRGDFFSKWYLDGFLKIIITYPENENMLLKFHISKEARQYILLELVARIDAWINDMYSANPRLPAHREFETRVNRLISKIDAVSVKNPYSPNNEIMPIEAPSESHSISVCASEIVRVLEALSPQVMHSSGSFDQFATELTECTSAFQAQYSYASDRFERLKRELLLILEPGSSSSEVHACKEQWLELEIDAGGEPRCITENPQSQTSTTPVATKNLDIAQKAALRICDDYDINPNTQNIVTYRTGIFHSQSLAKLLKDNINSTNARSDPISRIYWETALKTLNIKYPLSGLVEDDTPILRTLVHRSEAVTLQVYRDCTRLENEICVLDDISSRLRTTVTRFVGRYDDLKLKLWYSINVVNSVFYDNAKNIAGALNNMAVSPLRTITSYTASSQNGRRPRSSRSSTSSIFSQPVNDIMGVLKAPTQYGGPKKLADKQIENTRKWLQMSSIENFCKGEERIHRFCMEVATAAKNLVGETLSESPDLWASELFARESSYYDIHSSFGVSSAPASTRPASVMSELLPTVFRSARPQLRSSDSARTSATDDRRSGASRIDRSFLHPDLASSIGSPGRAYSATTAESISTFWSPLPSNTRSMTSASIYSRPASTTFNENQSSSRLAHTNKEKKKFLQKARQTLVCLLLSDLGCPVWSLGSETDAWLDSSRSNDKIDKRLQQRMATETLLHAHQQFEHLDALDRPRQRRSKSFSDRIPFHEIEQKRNGVASGEHQVARSLFIGDRCVDQYLEGSEELLTKLGQLVDPNDKLLVVGEIHDLTVLQVREIIRSSQGAEKPQSRLDNMSPRTRRRNSLESVPSRSALKSKKHDHFNVTDEPWDPSEQQIVKQLKLNLTKLRSRTIFRDLQYIAAFVPAEMTDKTSLGKAFLRFGLAAFDYKDEVCRTLVDVADKLVVRDNIKRSSSVDPPESTIMKAAEYWMTAAREGNAVAQRELATLYLSHPKFLPIMTLPLSASSDIFKSDMLWHERNEINSSTQALCLAVHWMQLAAENGDKLAQQKLNERKGRISIR